MNTRVSFGEGYSLTNRPGSSEMRLVNHSSVSISASQGFAHMGLFQGDKVANDDRERRPFPPRTSTLSGVVNGGQPPPKPLSAL